MGVEPGEVVEAAGQGRQGLDRLLVDVRGRARAAGVDERVHIRGDGHRLGDCLDLELEGDVRLVPELDGQPLLHLVLETREAGGDRVRPPDPHVGDLEAALEVGDARVGGAGRGVDGRDAHAGQHGAALVDRRPAQDAGRLSAGGDDEEQDQGQAA